MSTHTFVKGERINLFSGGCFLYRSEDCQDDVYIKILSHFDLCPVYFHIRFPILSCFFSVRNVP